MSDAKINAQVDRGARQLTIELRKYFAREKELLKDVERMQTRLQAVESTMSERVVLLTLTMTGILQWVYRLGHRFVWDKKPRADALFDRRVKQVIINTNKALVDYKGTIEEFYERTVGWRSKSIAITETNSAFNSGIQAAAVNMQSDYNGFTTRAAMIGPIQKLAKLAMRGGIVYKRWVAQADDRVRDDHADAHGQIKRVHLPFEVGGEGLMFPGDPDGSPDNIINCRCYQKIFVRAS